MDLEYACVIATRSLIHIEILVTRNPKNQQNSHNPKRIHVLIALNVENRLYIHNHSDQEVGNSQSDEAHYIQNCAKIEAL